MDEIVINWPRDGFFFVPADGRKRRPWKKKKKKLPQISSSAADLEPVRYSENK
jgi:hypothetical protein